MHSHPGKITNIRDHEDGKHAQITVTHGKRKRSKGSDGQPGDLMGYHQHTSNITIPKAHAKNYTLGQSVQAGIAPNEGSMDEDPTEIGQNGAVSEGAAVPGKQSGATSVKPAKSAKARSKIRAALNGKKK